VGNSTPVIPYTPETMVTKIGVGDDIDDPYPRAKFHYDSIGSILFPRPSCDNA